MCIEYSTGWHIATQSEIVKNGCILIRFTSQFRLKTFNLDFIFHTICDFIAIFRCAWSSSAVLIWTDLLCSALLSVSVVPSPSGDTDPLLSHLLLMPSTIYCCCTPDDNFTNCHTRRAHSSDKVFNLFYLICSAENVNSSCICWYQQHVNQPRLLRLCVCIFVLLQDLHYEIALLLFNLLKTFRSNLQHHWWWIMLPTGRTNKLPLAQNDATDEIFFCFIWFHLDWLLISIFIVIRIYSRRFPYYLYFREFSHRLFTHNWLIKCLLVQYMNNWLDLRFICSTHPHPPHLLPREQNSLIFLLCCVKPLYF